MREEITLIVCTPAVVDGHCGGAVRGRVLNAKAFACSGAESRDAHEIAAPLLGDNYVSGKRVNTGNNGVLQQPCTCPLTTSADELFAAQSCPSACKATTRQQHCCRPASVPRHSYLNALSSPCSAPLSDALRRVCRRSVSCRRRQAIETAHGCRHEQQLP
jgi:hypothetical protein